MKGGGEMERSKLAMKNIRKEERKKERIKIFFCLWRLW